MMNFFHKKINFVFIISILMAVLNQSTFAKNATCSIEIFSHEKYGSTYNGPCSISINENLSSDSEKTYVVTRLNPDHYLFQKVTGIQTTDYADYTSISTIVGNTGSGPHITNNAKKYTEKNKVCRADKDAGFKLCIW